MNYLRAVRFFSLINILLWTTSCTDIKVLGNRADLTLDQPEAHFSILQINDTYKIEGLENGSIGGFARLRTLRKQLEDAGDQVLLLHGGDILFPSVMSKYLKGDGMIKILNLMDGHESDFDDRMIVVFGNHEFDDPDPGVLLGRIAQSDFAWISSNVRYRSSGKSSGSPFSERLSNAHEVLIKDINGLKVGLFGITLDSQQPPYVSFDYDLEVRRKVISKAIADLKAKGAIVIIALTHQTLDQDQWLAHEYPEINLIIGGHEHFYIEQQVGKTWITKADADIQSAVLHDVRVLTDGSVETRHRKIEVSSKLEKDARVDAEVSKQLTRLTEELSNKNKVLNQVLGYTRYLLEGVEPAVRGRETALGNFLTDVIREHMKTDIAFTNGGGIRMNDNIPPGPITVYDMEGLFYYDNGLVSFELSGAQLMEVLKNSVSKSHLGDGRFLQVSGLRFKYLAMKSNDDYSYSIAPADVEVKLRGNSAYQPLDINKKYRVATNDFIWEKGFTDGYNLFAKGAGKSSPTRLDNGTAVSFRKTVEEAISKLPDKTVSHQIEGRIIREEQ
ncbi:bifunctional UDP-sugar hydrolase/5'-nucleotidase [Methylicorpusculum sp.]|uniref:bifunctional metallophosphatase/5'-nucleotidase n=1 Tax=Methylicorpusculum sp. TaxID=2713644 RepID=UPI002AC8FDBC|nr:bifunctional UDP-sugar hydrolase/5'-nucleotidase [Methylicorpusculum sp.]